LGRASVRLTRKKKKKKSSQRWRTRIGRPRNAKPMEKEGGKTEGQRFDLFVEQMNAEERGRKGGGTCGLAR